MSLQQLYAKTALGFIDSANSSMTGAGATTIYTASLDGGTISSIAIKAQGQTTPGMVRIFLQDSGGGTTELLFEVAIPGMPQSGTQPSFGIVIPLNFVVESGYKILASTQNGEPFNIIVSATDWENCSCPA